MPESENSLKPIAPYGSLYFMIQAVAGFVGWILLLRFPEVQYKFVRSGADPDSVFDFAFPDAIVFIIASMFVSRFYGTGHWLWLTWLVAGATCYAGLYGLSTFLFAGASIWLPIVAILPAIFSTLFAFAQPTDEKTRADEKE